jgi:hypothetical protein
MPTAGNDALDAVVAVARDAGLWRIVEDTHDTVGRPRSGLLSVVCVGQFKRRESTLLNGLVEEAVLPTGVVPISGDESRNPMRRRGSASCTGDSSNWSRGVARLWPRSRGSTHWRHRAEALR